MLVKLAILAACVVVLLVPPAYGQSQSSSALTCRVTSTTKKHDSGLVKSTLIRLKIIVSWCHNGKKISRVNVSCQVTENDPFTVAPSNCETGGGYVGWNSYPNGGYRAQASVGYKNCPGPDIFDFLCQNRVLNMELWLQADGSARS